MKTPQYIFIHHTAVSYKKNPKQWPATDAYHKSKGWGGGGYNYEIAADGTIHQFRADGSMTAAQYQKNMNDGRAISICLDGQFDSELPTPEQKATVAKMLIAKMEKYKIPRENIFCHRHVAQKTCPGKLLPDNIADYFLGPLKPVTPDWAKEAIQNAVKSKMMTQNFADSADFNKTLQINDISEIFQKFGLFKDQGNITLARLIVAFDRLGVFKQ